MSRNRDRLRVFALPAALAAALASTRCELVNNPSPETYFDVQVPDSLTAYGRVVVLLNDATGNLIDTLYAGALTSPSQLAKLPVPGFQAAVPVQVQILGLVGDSAVYSQTRYFDPLTQSVQPLPPPSSSTTSSTTSSPSSSTTPASTRLNAPAAGFALTPADTVLPAGDSLVFRVTASGSTLPVRVLWDENGDGIWDDSLRPDPGDPAMVFGFRSTSAETATPVVARLFFAAGDSLTLQARVTVAWDPPTAAAGPDTSVPVGGVILLHAGGTSAVRAIAARAWKIDDGAFWSVPWENTTTPAPAVPGVYDFVLRVTDTDSLTAVDTMVVTVTP